MKVIGTWSAPRAESICLRPGSRKARRNRCCGRLKKNVVASSFRSLGITRGRLMIRHFVFLSCAGFAGRRVSRRTGFRNWRWSERGLGIRRQALRKFRAYNRLESLCSDGRYARAISCRGPAKHALARSAGGNGRAPLPLLKLITRWRPTSRLHPLERGGVLGDFLAVYDRFATGRKVVPHFAKCGTGLREQWFGGPPPSSLCNQRVKSPIGE